MEQVKGWPLHPLVQVQRAWSGAEMSEEVSPGCILQTYGSVPLSRPVLQSVLFHDQIEWSLIGGLEGGSSGLTSGILVVVERCTLPHTPTR